MKTARHKIITTIRDKLFSFILACFSLCLFACAAHPLAFCQWQGGDSNNTARWLHGAFTCSLYTPTALEQLVKRHIIGLFSGEVNLYIHTRPHPALILQLFGAKVGKVPDYESFRVGMGRWGGMVSYRKTWKYTPTNQTALYKDNSSQIENLRGILFFFFWPCC